MSLLVVRAGVRTTVQDLGRPGYAALGVSPSGAVDRSALRLANRLLGNPEGAAALECTMGGLVVRAQSPHWCAVTGARAPVRVDGRPEATGSPFFLRAGAELTIGVPERGLRSYLAVNGGLLTAELLGSRSEDTLGGIVPFRVTEGSILPTGPSTADVVGAVDRHDSPLPPVDGPLEARIVPGPRRDWMAEQSWSVLTRQTFTVSDRTDRIGVRLSGTRLERSVHEELPSEGLIRGAVQLPPSGEPIIFLADHPTTGGYPVIAVVDDSALDLVAQLVPGQHLRFRA